MPLKVPHALLEEIRLNNDIATVIGGYFALQRSGSAFKALCPFHKEKTPSFMVNPQRQIFHCFGCGAGGDVFRFVMDFEKVDFMAAVKLLARRAGIRLQLEADSTDGRFGKETLYEINAAVAGLYQEILLKKPEGAAARDYLAARSLPAAAVAEFAIGFAPESWDTLLRWAGKKYAPEQLEAAGLVIPAKARPARNATHSVAGGPEQPASKGWYDRFRNRLMFPIRDEQGRVVGFSGRVLTEQAEQAKYVNTPETALFRKGHVLYALDKARRAIVEARAAIVCEGQIDVIRCHLAGFPTAVAAQGTAFTADHARILKRYADSVVLVGDADRAGQDAALRAADTFLQAGLAVRIAALPEGEDPDSLLRHEDGPAQFRGLLSAARSLLDFQIDVLAGRERLDTEAGLMRVAAAVVATIARTPNAVQQARLIQQAAERLAVPALALERELDKVLKRSRPQVIEPTGKTVAATLARPLKELALAGHLVANPQLCGLVRTYLPLDMVTDPLCRQVMRVCLEAEQSGTDVMGIIAQNDNEERELFRFVAQVLAVPSTPRESRCAASADLSRFAAQALVAPNKVQEDLKDQAAPVKLLILDIRAAALQRRRKEINQFRQTARLNPAQKLTLAEEKKLNLEYTQLGYDIARLKQWDTAVPVMESG
ncbi:MAG: DNA primase [Lentisphaerae bacterium]|nr:DNA primase [Lentisphaerota bacterium]